MQRLTAMTLGAALLGLAAFAYDSASAQEPQTCSSHAVAVYFEKGSTLFNEFSQQLVERMAQEARSCGAGQVVVEAAAGPERAEAVSDALQDLGVKVILVSPPAIAPRGDSIASRAVTIRVGQQPTSVG